MSELEKHNELSILSYEEINDKLSLVCHDINVREQEVLVGAGVNTNSIVGGLANGSICVKTNEESMIIHNLKQELMARTGIEMLAARKRNLARRAARRVQLKQTLTT
jgi:hypothetical protein